MKYKIKALLCLPIVISASASTNTINQALIDAREAALEAEIAVNNGSPWMFIGTSNYELDYYVDLTSIDVANLDNSPTKAVWKTVDSQGDYTMTLSEFDCSKGAAIDILSARYTSNDEYLGHTNVSGDIRFINLRTVFSGIIKQVCEYSSSSDYI